MTASLKTGSGRIKFIVWLIGTLCILPVPIFIEPTHGLDPSWKISLNYAIKNKLIFGDQFVFTYGPLGYLLTGLKLFVPVIPILLFKLVFVVGWSIIIRGILKTINNYLAYALLIALLFLGGRVFHFAYETCLPLFVFFLMVMHYNDGTAWQLCLAVCIALFSIYIKVNVGFVLMPVLNGYLLLLLIVKRLSWRWLLLIVIIQTALILLLNNLLHVHFASYIANSFEIIRGYNEAMTEQPLNALTHHIGLLLTVLLLIGIAWHLRLYYRNLLYSYLLICGLGLLFVLFKQAFVRCNSLNQLPFFALIPFMVWAAFWLPRNHQPIISQKVLFLLQAGCIICMLLVRFLPASTIDYQMPSAFFDGKKFEQPADTFPHDIVQMIGTHTVDIFPTDISYLHSSGLNYKGRAVPQSYSAYTPVLDSLDAAQIATPAGPDFALMAYGSIDNRYPLWDEPLTTLSVLTNYDHKASCSLYSKNDSLTLNRRLHNIAIMQRRDLPRKTKITDLGEVSSYLDKAISIPAGNGGLVLAYVDVAYNTMGNIEKMLLQCPRIYCTLAGAGDSLKNFRAIVPLMKTGVIVNYMIASPGSYDALLKNDYALLPQANSLTLHSPTGGFIDKIRVRFKRLQFE